MTSSMLTGERRWASSRRGGMTVLGKVAVPKPINLPSQKLENHGLDPNVEIVPKGTLSWGSKSSSSTSNPWGSSIPSPNAADGTGSPSHLSGRPSSGGSGTRPSTGSSDRAHEPIGNSWSSSSRPSSASGALTSNQTSVTSLRPRSAEPRPGSSQLSRFAEPASENSVAWGSAGTAEKLGVTTSRNDGFSLASGDFPTLGSEKDNAGKNTDSQDHGSHSRPGSSSGGVAPVKDRVGTSLTGDVSANVNVKSGNTNSWRREGNLYNEEGVRPNVEKWQADPQGPQTYPNTGMPPQHFDAWHGPPLNNHPGGVWYRGPPAGPPYGSPVPPGGFPMEPFHFYRPQIPHGALPNPQPVPPPGAGPRPHHTKTGDMYRPQMPDAYMRPGMPIRPGFYPGPVPYEGYYGPPMGYRNSNERDMPFMGVAAGPSAYNRYSSQNAHDSGNSHNRSSGYGPNGKGMGSEQVESGHPGDARGPYRVLLKQHDGWDGKDEEQNWEDTVATKAPHIEKGDQPRTSRRENDWRGDYRKNEEMGLKGKVLGEEASFPSSDHGGGSSVPVKVKSPESKGNAKAFDDISVKAAEHASAAAPEILVAPRDCSLIEKIEGLNAKVRAADGRHDVLSVSSREEQKNKSRGFNAEAIHSTNEAATGSVYFGRNHATKINNPAACEVGVSAGDTDIESMAASGTVVARRSVHGVHGRVDHRGKGKSNNHEVDAWRKKSPGADASSLISATESEGYNNLVQGHTPEMTSENSRSYSHENDGGESIPPVFDASDSEAQRFKMRELAKQRVKQRQKEEEERARDQKAKALAKLEELNKRTLTVEGLTQKLEVPSGSIQYKQDEYQSLAEPTIVARKSGMSGSILASNPNAVQISDSGTGRVEKSIGFSNEPLIERPKSAQKEPLGTHKNESLTVKHDGSVADVVHLNNASNVYDGSAANQKRVGYKQKQNNPLEKNISEKLVTAGASDAPKGRTDVIVGAASAQEVVANETAASSESNLPVNPNVMTESSMHQRRRNTRSGKKHKVEEASSATTAALSSVVLAETNVKNTLVESGEIKVTESKLDPISAPAMTNSKDANQSSEQRLSSPNEENHGRATNQWKSQHSRRLPRSGQANKSAEKFHTSDAVVWAPVRTQNKAEVTAEASQKSVVEASSTKNDHQVQNNSRNKRAEMERYIPKPVAKEMAQQGSNQQQLMVPLVDQTTSDEIGGKTDSGSLGKESAEDARFASGKVGVAMESRNGDGRHNKQGKVHGSWRQRTSTESTIVQGSQEGQSSNASGNFQKLTEHQQPQNPNVSSEKEQPKCSDDWGVSDGWNMPEISDSAVPLTIPAVKDQAVTARGKRHQFKGHKGTGNNHYQDNRKINSGDTDKIHVPSPIPVPEMSHTDVLSASKENRVFGDRSVSHWQPKPQASSASNQRGSRSNSSQNVGADAGRANKKDSMAQVGLPPPRQPQPQPEKEIREGVTEPSHGQFTSQTKVEKAQSYGHQEPKRERKMASSKGRPHSPNQGPGSMVESVPQSNMDIQHEHTSSGFRRNGNQNSRFGRGTESRGDWNSSGQDNKQINQPINRDRQRHSSHYEYQPVGPYNNNRSNNYEGAKDGPNNAGGRYRERGQSHSRRGWNFQGRPSGVVRADGHE